VSDLIQETGYYPLNIQPSGKLKYICFSKFDPGTRTTIEDGLEYFGPTKDMPIILSKELMNKLGLPKTTITLERVDDGKILDPPTYKITIVSNGSTVTETIGMGAQFPESSTFLGNSEKDKRISELCENKLTAPNKKLIKDLIISKLLGDKLQVIGTLLYIVSKYGSSREVLGEYDKVCLFTVDKVVATLCRILGISCCLQRMEGEEEEEVVEEKNSKGGVLKVFRVKYFPTFVDARTLYTSSLDIELNAALKNNIEVRNNLGLFQYDDIPTNSIMQILLVTRSINNKQANIGGHISSRIYSNFNDEHCFCCSLQCTKVLGITKESYNSKI
jgi:hypothetical protein